MKNRKNNTTLTFRLTQTEFEQIKRKAHENYKTVSAYLRDLGLGYNNQ